MKKLLENKITYWCVTIAILLIVWQFFPSLILPKPLEVLSALVKMWNEGLAIHIYTSVKVQTIALVVSLVVSLIFAYLARIPLFKPIVIIISNLRFISVAPLVLFFTFLISSNGEVIKLWLLVFSISVFYITSMVEEVTNIPQYEFDHARTLHMSEWRVFWEVVVLGTSAKALEIFRQNAAMGWMAITLIEGIVKGSGGIGNLLLIKQKYMVLADIMGIIIVLFVIGFILDKLIATFIRLIFPYYYLEVKR